MNGWREYIIKKVMFQLKMVKHEYGSDNISEILMRQKKNDTPKIMSCTSFTARKSSPLPNTNVFTSSLYSYNMQEITSIVSRYTVVGIR